MMIVDPYRFASAPSGDPHIANVLVLVGAEGVDGAAVVNDAPSGVSISRLGTPQIDDAQFKFGAASWKFDGANDTATFGSNSLFGFAGEFTIETFMRFSTVSIAMIGSKGASTSSYSWDFLWSSTNILLFRAASGGLSLSTPWTPSAGVWYHVAVDRDAGGVVRIYIDGVMGNKATYATALSTTGSVVAGTSPDQQWDFNGWFDEYRITAGVARYASDAGFTVPTAAFPRS